MNNCEFIESRVTPSAALCQLAEEAAELAQAALKIVRTLDGNNPTPYTYDEAVDELCEEIADVNVCATVVMDKLKIGYEGVSDLEVEKFDRWAKRLKNPSGVRDRKHYSIKDVQDMTRAQVRENLSDILESIGRWNQCVRWRISATDAELRSTSRTIIFALTSVSERDTAWIFAPSV